MQLLERVEEILRGPELYAPQVKEDRHEEPIVSELISALLSVNTKTFIISVWNQLIPETISTSFSHFIAKK